MSVTEPPHDLRNHMILAQASGALRGSQRETVELIRERIAALRLDLSGLSVVTEAATGSYAVTAVIAAMAGARRVRAIARDTVRYGSFRDAAEATHDLAEVAGVKSRIAISRRLSPEAVAACDILTNSGHLRPITREIVARLKPGAVIGLMFEAWEFRAADLDLEACRQFGVPVVAVNECHPDVGVFPFLGPLCHRLLSETGAGEPGSRVAVVCDNPFAPYLHEGLRSAGVLATVVAQPEEVRSGPWDAVVIALNPAWNAPLGAAELGALSRAAPGARLVQFWGDIDRAEAARHGFSIVWPAMAPARGHMGILLDALGEEPIVRLQAGGLKAAELAVRGVTPTPGGIHEFL